MPGDEGGRGGRRQRLQGFVGHGKESGLYIKNKRKLLKGFKQGHDSIGLGFLKNLTVAV